MNVGFELTPHAECNSTEISILSGLARGDRGPVERHFKDIRAAVVSDTAHNVEPRWGAGDKHVSTPL